MPRTHLEKRYFKDECYSCKRSKTELEESSGLARTLITDSHNFLSFCDDCYYEDGSYTCAGCDIVFKEYKPDCRTRLGKALWKEYGTDKTVRLAHNSNIYCTKCVEN